jgi:DNA-binding transcriptional MerR regulator
LKDIYQTFSTRDFELITGIKTATLRMWERRYGLFSPTKGNRNIRTYSIDDFQKLLNIVFLLDRGLKISKLAEMSEQNLNEKVLEYVTEESQEDYWMLSLKKALINLDGVLFERTYQEMISKLTFDVIFETQFMKFFHLIGILWQTKIITPIQEHFISNLIAQKIHIHTEKEKITPTEDSDLFILFLVEGEIHELGLLYINYILQAHGKKTIYLGASIPKEDLRIVGEKYPNAKWATYFTMNVDSDNWEEYQNYLMDNHLDTYQEFWLIGNIPNSIRLHKTMSMNYLKDVGNAMDSLMYL